MDRTLLSSFSNKESFYPYTSSYWDYRYINNPLTSTLIQGDSLWIGFDGHYTGIWKLNILSENVELVFQYQKKTEEEYDDDFMMEGTFDRYFQYIRFSFIHNDKLYFVEDTLPILSPTPQYTLIFSIIIFSEQFIFILSNDGVLFLSGFIHIESS